MDASSITAALEVLYGDIGMSDEAFEAVLDRSLNPRGPEMLYEKMAALGLNSAHRVLDIGCRDAGAGLKLAERFGCTMLGVDPVQHNLDRARRRIAASDHGALVHIRAGAIEAIPADDGEFDFIWCRDMLNHVPDLQAGFRECARVLKPGGRMLIWVTLATDLLEPNEAARLYAPLAVVARNMAPAFVEQAFTAAGFRVLERDVIGSEWRERYEEDGTRTTSRQLLKIARMQRDRARLSAELGPGQLEAELADCHWGVYTMLGKLSPIMYVLERP